jgi:hypothetical protein
MNEWYEIRTVEQSDRWVFRIVEAGIAEPAAWESDGKSYLTREEC